MSSLSLLCYFFRLGLTGFGGPLAVIAQIQRDLVDQRKVIDEDEFLRSLSLIKSLPGAVSVQVVFSANLGETFCHRRDGGDCSRNFAGSCFNCRNSHRCANGFSSFTFNYEFSFQNSKLGDCGRQWD
jgi:hypothetical protein